jgi:hypothetical protein
MFHILPDVAPASSTSKNSSDCLSPPDAIAGNLGSGADISEECIEKIIEIIGDDKEMPWLVLEEYLLRVEHN